MKRMQEYETLKVYKDIVNQWTAEDDRGREIITQVEVAYKEYDANGNLIRTGTEDFSWKRWKETRYYRIFTWDGARRNAGGFRWFQEAECAHIAAGNRYKLQHVAEAWNSKAALVELRAI